MIKVNELRVGNWIGYGSPFRLPGWMLQNQELGGGEFDYYIDFDPIPLTPEILGKCGFSNDIFWAGKDYSIDIGESHKEGVLSITDTGEYYIHYNCYHDSSGGKAKIQHLHQLQNLYHALTGEELPINL